MCTDFVVAGMYAIHFGNTYYKAILVLALLTDLPKVGMYVCFFLRKHATLGMQVSVLRREPWQGRREVCQE